MRSGFQSLERASCGHEFYEPKSWLAKPANATGVRPPRVSADEIGTSRWPYRCIPTIATNCISAKAWAGWKSCKLRNTGYHAISPAHQAHTSGRRPMYRRAIYCEGIAFLCAQFSIYRVLSGSRLLLFRGCQSAQHKRSFVGAAPCVVEQSESFRSERLRSGGWMHGVISDYTVSVIRAGRMACQREACNTTRDISSKRIGVRLLSIPQWLHT